VTREEALEALLKGTGLTYQALDEVTVSIVPVAPQSWPSAPTSRIGVNGAGPAGTQNCSDHLSVWSRVRLAQASSTVVSQERDGGSGSTANPAEQAPLTSVIVTANRRLERAQDVPSTLQVFSGESLEKQGADGFADYLTTVPGLGFRNQGNGTSKITIRGISNVGGHDAGWGTTTTTGVYLNDVAIQGTDIPPDLALYDLERIEVLKGPQGTLYGEGAMGGAIKMTVKRPTLNEFGAKTDLSAGSTQSGGLNYALRGAVNVPVLSDRAALRLVGTYSDEDGFVDNVTRGENNHDHKKGYSLRAILLAQVTDALSAEVLALNNVRKLDDFPQIDSSSGYRISSAEDRYNDVDSNLLALTLKNDFAFAELTSVTARLRLDRDFFEQIVFGRPFFAPYGPLTQDGYRYQTGLESLSQELRLVSKGHHRIDWIVGAFYRDKDQKAPNTGFIAAGDLPAVNAGLAAASLPQLPADGRYFESFNHQKYTQYALYGEGKLDVGRGFDFTVGLRWYDETVETSHRAIGYSAMAASTNVNLLPPIKETGLVPKVALSYRLSDDNLLYVQAAKGFRAGSGNSNFAIAGDEGAESDSLWSYEAGSKNAWFGGRVIFNTSVFFLDWKGIQSSVNLTSRIDPAIVVPVTENAGNAEVYGAEAEVAASPTRTFSIGAALGYTHSKLISSLGNFLVGAALPGTPEWTVSGYGRYGIPVSVGEAYARFDVRYVGEQTAKLMMVGPAGNITSDGFPMKAYTLGNIRVGLDRDSGWGFSLFVDNIWNERAMLGRGYEGGSIVRMPQRFTVERPRTYGLSVTTLF
jgi:outer membrane receptor protein involved in Fe transport